MGMRRGRGRRGAVHRRLKLDGLEARRLLAAEMLVGSAWEEVWRGRTTDGEAVEAQLAAHGDFNGDGRSDLIVVQPSGNAVWLQAEDGSYADGLTIPGPYVPTWVTADIDNDGDLDLVATSESTLHVLINAGDSQGEWGGFELQPGKPLEFLGASSVMQLSAADWSGDGRTDLAFATTGGVVVRLSDASNTLGPPIAYPLQQTQQRRLVSGDFDGDGDLDLASAASSYTGTSLDLLENDGEGIFEPRPTGVQAATLIRDLVAGDVDRDGDLDLVLAYQYSYDGNLEIFTNNGQGGFVDEPTPLTVAGSPNRLALGDVDDDGDLDLVVSHYGGLHIPYSGAPGISIFMGQPNGVLGPRQYVNRSDSRGVMIESLRDGTERTLTVFSWNGGIQVLRPVTPELIAPEVETDSDAWSSPGGQNIVATGDWNGDGRDDVVRIEQRFGGPILRISLGLAQPDSTYVWTPLPVIDDGQSWMVAELTGDDRVDIGLTRYNSPSFVVIPQSQTGAPGNPVSTQLPGNFYFSDSLAHDLNDDQLPDVLMRGDTGAVRALLGTGAGQFTLGPVITTASDMRVADLNGDIRPDLVTISGSSLRTLLGQSGGSFQESDRVAIDANSYMQVWEDFTSDGRPDLILASGTTLETRIFTGSADGTLREASGSPLQSAGYLEPRYPDIDLDGRNDLLFVAGEVGKLIVWKTNADGSLADAIETAIPRQAYPHVQHDVNGDQLLDFVLASQTRVVVLLGRGDGSFDSALEPLRVTNGLAHFSADTDFDGDAREDLLMLSSEGLQIWTWDAAGSLVEFFKLPLSASEFWVSRTEDFNGDEIDDYIYVESSTNRSHVLVSGTESPFVDAFSFPADANVVHFADLTGDGIADAVTQTWNGHAKIWRNDGNWSFEPLDLALPELGMMLVTDVNQDGLADLLGQAGDSFVAWLNIDGVSFAEYFDMHANGSFALGPSSDSNTIVRGDLNHDGHSDIVVGWSAPGPGQRLTLLLTEDDGSFARPVGYVFPKSFNLRHIVLGDVDGDGDLDITLEGTDASYWGEVTEITRQGVILNQADQYWPVGDSNRDGRFNSADLVAVFASGQYEDDLPGNSTWLEGDWNGDGDFTSQDLVLAFQLGTYVAAAEVLEQIEPADLRAIAARLSDDATGVRKAMQKPADEPMDGEPRSLTALHGN